MIAVDMIGVIAGMGAMGDRLREARIAAKIKSARQAALRLGVPYSTYSAHENGQNDYDPAAADLYARRFGVRGAWLLTGELPKAWKDELIRVPDSEAAGFAREGDRYIYKPSAPGGRPEIDVTPGAGEGAVGEVFALSTGMTDAISAHRVIGEWVFPSSFLRSELKAGQDSTVVMEIKGDSMLPTLSPGDRVIVDLRQNIFGPDAVYVIDDGDSEPRVKRLRKVTASSPAEVDVVSDNPVQQSDRVSLDRIRVIGRVVGRVSRL